MFQVKIDISDISKDAAAFVSRQLHAGYIVFPVRDGAGSHQPVREDGVSGAPRGWAGLSGISPAPSKQG
ncbi:hypothetical protein AB9K34_13160 [Sedimentitalea sp. XS_ASV28]|uniref:hypothetical protein n=1 Tax=Sedimentitalea sp. XS_ASV28 TaxID=3241296 RepID=UPI003515820B